MNRYPIYFLLTGALFAAAGCSRRDHTPPPVERTALAVRFFNSIERRDSAAAVRQGRKLHALNGREYILRLISIHESNETVRDAQNKLQAGRINDSLAIISAAAKKYPHNLTLKSTYPKLVQLRNAEKLLSAMEEATNASSMRGARIAARAGLSKNITPEFSAYLKNYEAREKAVAEKEKQTTEANLQAAKSAAEQARRADARRQEENARFMQETAKKTEAGEKMRKAAGDVPFAVGDGKDAPAGNQPPAADGKKDAGNAANPRPDAAK